MALDTLEAKRMAANIGSFMHFAHDWQTEHPRGTLAGFVDYLDAYQGAGGELPTSVEASDDLEGVRLMTLYQAKGLEFGHVFVPQLLKDEWPTREYASGLFPAELLREAVPSGDLHTEEERRLLYVALTRARDRLVVTTIAGPGAPKDPSPFLADLRDGAGAELRVTDRADGVPPAPERAVEPLPEPVPRVMPPPTPRERRLALRVRAAELLQMLEGIAPDDPEAGAARHDLAAEFAALDDRAVESADEARAHRLDPLTLRVLALDSVAGANLLQVAPLPTRFSYSQVDTYQRCPLLYAFRHVYRIPSDRQVGALTFGSTAHAAFEAFTRERRERAARGEPPPTREDLGRLFEAEWKEGGFDERTAEENYRRRVSTLLDNFWTGELSSLGTAAAEELGFELVLEVPDDEPAVFVGSIDRIDRLPSGGIEVIDYKTGKTSSQKGVDENVQLSIYALACRDALGLGTPERVTLYFTESATRRARRGRTSSSTRPATRSSPGCGDCGRGTSPRPRARASAGAATTPRCARAGSGSGTGNTWRRTRPGPKATIPCQGCAGLLARVRTHRSGRQCDRFERWLRPSALRRPQGRRHVHRTLGRPVTSTTGHADRSPRGT